MSTTYEPQAIEPPDLELILSAYLRSVGPSTVLYGRRYPASLPMNGLSVAAIIRDDGGSWPNRTISLNVIGARDASYAETRAIAAALTSKLATLALAAGLPVGAVTAVRGPLSVADNPPEFHAVADLILVGQPT